MTVDPVQMHVLAIPGIPRIFPGDDLAAVVIGAIEAAGVTVSDGDILVMAQKIVSKAEGRYVDLATVTASARANELASIADKDPRVVELILSESSEVLRCVPGVIVVVHRLGYVLANAGIDASNLEPGGDGQERVLLLPRDPNATSAAMRSRFEAHFRRRIGVIVSDSIGRAWRMGTVGTALGVAGPLAVWDQIGTPDLSGRPLRTTMSAFADQVASAAVLVMGEAAEGLPVAKVGGLQWDPVKSDGTLLLRPKEKDLFR
ncbi:MAG: coenzyme F420-0:L-glutamate ligase [Gammaproteobacteria bacterium]|nr:coenzyme F420-0:L-glutamate ligase [Gammaproteobacteria bacterium]